jgi:hypothetical protein
MNSAVNIEMANLQDISDKISLGNPISTSINGIGGGIGTIGDTLKQQSTTTPQPPHNLDDPTGSSRDSTLSDDHRHKVINEEEEGHHIVAAFERREEEEFHRYESIAFGFLHDPIIKYARSRSQRRILYVIAFLKQLLVAIGGVVFWVGLWELIDVYLFPQSLYTELGCVTIGTLIFSGLILLFRIPALHRRFLDRGWKGYLLRVTRDCLYVIFAVVVWKGLYNIFDIYMPAPTVWRAVIYTVCGMGVLIVSNSLTSNTTV